MTEAWWWHWLAMRVRVYIARSIWEKGAAATEARWWSERDRRREFYREWLSETKKGPTDWSR